MKPIIPGDLRWMLRRVRAPGILRRHHATWPIDEAAGALPPDWKGWPEGHEFALVLTHDVESAAGVQKARQLAELELHHGFCSSFNFIPEGPYQDPMNLRSWLANHGFEIGVHDLNHDGHLYESRGSFRRKAKSINHYLKRWGAVGFRSGFMLHQLDWLHELDILYDSSTFDTDPFEPQPEGSRTIFPFHIKPCDTRNRSYVELSYTLPQDSTLFLLLKQTSPHVWILKLEWIARHGGLALINIHPDYIDFKADGSCHTCYPAPLVREFLEHVNSHYAGRFWNPLARDLAAWFQTQANPASPVV